jgi:hypothetical protein
LRSSNIQRPRPAPPSSTTTSHLHVLGCTSSLPALHVQSLHIHCSSSLKSGYASAAPPSPQPPSIHLLLLLLLHHLPSAISCCHPHPPPPPPPPSPPLFFSSLLPLSLFLLPLSLLVPIIDRRLESGVVFLSSVPLVFSVRFLSSASHSLLSSDQAVSPISNHRHHHRRRLLLVLPRLRLRLRRRPPRPRCFLLPVSWRSGRPSSPQALIRPATLLPSAICLRLSLLFRATAAKQTYSSCLLLLPCRFSSSPSDFLTSRPSPFLEPFRDRRADSFSHLPVYFLHLLRVPSIPVAQASQTLGVQSLSRPRLRDLKIFHLSLHPS